MRDRRERVTLPHGPMGVFYRNTRKAHCSLRSLQIIIWLRCTRQVKQKHSLGKKGEDVPFCGPTPRRALFQQAGVCCVKGMHPSLPQGPLRIPKGQQHGWLAHSQAGCLLEEDG